MGVWHVEINFFVFVLLPINIRQLLIKKNFVVGGYLASTIKVEVLVDGIEKCFLDPKDYHFWIKNITNYPLTPRGVEFLKFSFLYVEDSFLSFIEIIKINESGVIFFNRNFQFIRQK